MKKISGIKSCFRCPLRKAEDCQEFIDLTEEDQMLAMEQEVIIHTCKLEDEPEQPSAPVIAVYEPDMTDWIEVNKDRLKRFLKMQPVDTPVSTQERKNPFCPFCGKRKFMFSNTLELLCQCTDWTDQFRPIDSPKPQEDGK